MLPTGIEKSRCVAAASAAPGLSCSESILDDDSLVAGEPPSRRVKSDVIQRFGMDFARSIEVERNSRHVCGIRLSIAPHTRTARL
jgi:hypothetical protein